MLILRLPGPCSAVAGLAITTFLVCTLGMFLGSENRGADHTVVAAWWGDYRNSSEFGRLKAYEKRLAACGARILVSAVSSAAGPVVPAEIGDELLMRLSNELVARVWADDYDGLSRQLETWLKWLTGEGAVKTTLARPRLRLAEFAKILAEEAGDKKVWSAGKVLLDTAHAEGADLRAPEEMIHRLEGLYDRTYLEEFLLPPYPVVLNGEAYHFVDFEGLLD